MRYWRVVFAFVAVTGSNGGAQHAEQPGGLGVDYYPAYCREPAYASPGFKLEIFSSRKWEVPIQVPMRLGVFIYAPSGTALYTWSKGPEGTCLYKIEFKPVRVTPAACPSSLNVAFGIAIAPKEDRFIVSGSTKGELGLSCGVFEIRPLGGTIRQVLGIPSCGSHDDFVNSWRRLSLSPSADRAVAIRKDQLKLIGIDKGTTRQIGGGFLKASWSPDGRWIAALKLNGGTVLIDASDYKQRRTLPDSEVEWSPDSRYLLRIKMCRFPIAVNGVGTIQALDVSSGRSVTIKSSQCSIGTTAVGWVRNSVLPQTSASGAGDAPTTSLAGRKTMTVGRILER